MPDECEEIHFGGLLKKYTERPVSLENATLADWAAWYNNLSDNSYRKKSTKLDTTDNHESNDDELCDDINTVICHLKKILTKQFNQKSEQKPEL